MAITTPHPFQTIIGADLGQNMFAIRTGQMHIQNNGAPSIKAAAT
jgi:hypothetical protein